MKRTPLRIPAPLVTKVPDRRRAVRNVPLLAENRIVLQEAAERLALRETVLNALADALAVPKSGTRAGDGPSRDEAIAAAAVEYRTAEADRDELAAREGPRAVAEAAWPVVAGLKTAAEIEQQYRAMQDEARKRQAG